MWNASLRWAMTISICWADIRSRFLTRSVREHSIRCESWKKRNKSERSWLKALLQRREKRRAFSLSILCELARLKTYWPADCHSPRHSPLSLRNTLLYEWLQKHPRHLINAYH